MKSGNPLDYIAIQNVLALYCQGLDTKDFDRLDKVFVEDIEADYPFNSNLRGVESVRTAIKNRLGPIRTHHSLTTQSIIFSTDGREAFATSHFVGVHFGQNKHEGKMISAYGTYTDQLVLLGGPNDDEGVMGASGMWRIKTRKVAFTQRIGDENIMKEY